MQKHEQIEMNKNPRDTSRNETGEKNETGLQSYRLWSTIALEQLCNRCVFAYIRFKSTLQFSPTFLRRVVLNHEQIPKIQILYRALSQLKICTHSTSSALCTLCTSGEQRG
jgi:hypothetical protein